MKLNNYAILNDSNVCVDVISTVNNYDGSKGYVNIIDYNLTYFYKKYDEKTGWSQETYEPEIDSVIQDRLNSLETENSSLKQENIELKLALAELAESNESKITELQMAIAELAEMGV